MNVAIHTVVASIELLEDVVSLLESKTSTLTDWILLFSSPSDTSFALSTSTEMVLEPLSETNQSQVTTPNWPGCRIEIDCIAILTSHRNT